MRAQSTDEFECFTTIAGFADDLKLFDIIVSNFNVEAILNGYHQLDAVEKVSAEIVNKMGFACYKTGLECRDVQR